MQRPSTRRSFLGTAGIAAGAVAASGSLSALRAAAPVHGGVGDKIKVGLVGCGGRGSGAAAQALTADPDAVLWAMGDAFQDHLERSHKDLAESELGARVDVPPERRFVGLSAIDQVLAAGIDVVLLTTPPGFRPLHLEKAVAAGKHIFCEKPVATDAPGIRRVMAACAAARQKGLNVVSGLCYRYHDGRRAVVQKLHEGAVGDILAIHGTYLTGELWSFPRQPGWSELEWQLRNWLYYTWLSGDFIAEQHVHTLDVMAWIKQDVYPVRAYSLGGRQSRVDPLFGHVYDHFATVYEWADGTKGFSYCRQQNNVHRDVNEYVLGTAGKAQIFQHKITGKVEWQFQDKMRDMYQNEHDALFAAIRGKRPRIDNGDYMCKSSMMGILGRMAAYTGKLVTWDEAWKDEEVLVPDQLAWDMPLPKLVVAQPGRKPS